MNSPQLRHLMSATAALVLAGLIPGLSGCALGTLHTDTYSPIIGDTTPGPAFAGKVVGGQNPVSGARIYVYAAGQTTGYGQGATSLLTSAVATNNPGNNGSDSFGYYVTTNASGDFSVNNDFACPGATGGYPAEVYVLALSGDSGGGTNSAIALMAALGPCTTIAALGTTYPFIQINEVTTIAAAWALQQFMASPTTTAGSVNIGTSSTNPVGLENAFTTAASLSNVAIGLPISANSWATPEADRIYTLADIVSYCINSTTTGPNCTSLFTSVTPAGTMLSTKGIAASTYNPPLDTIAAAWYLAQFPNNIGGTGTCGTTAAAFMCIQSTGAPFTAMSTTPTDWTLAVGYAPKYATKSAITDPFSVAVDAYGNIWVDNLDASATNVLQLAPNGSVIYAPTTSYTVAANSGYAGSLVTTYGITSATAYTRTIASPRTITVDSNNNAWVADYNGAATNEVTISGGTFTCPTTTGEVCAFGTVAEFPGATAAGTASTAAVSGYYVPLYPWGAAADKSGNVYFNFNGGSTTYGSRITGKLSTATNSASSPGTFTPGLAMGTHNYGIVVDNQTSATNGPIVWATDSRGCADGATEFASLINQSSANSLATTNTYSGLDGTNTGCTTGVRDKITASTGNISDVVIDASNNLWLVNDATEALLGDPGPVGYTSTVTYAIVTAEAAGRYWVSTTDTYASLMSSSGLGGMNNPQYAEVDGAGNLWVSNFGAAAVSELAVTGALDTASMAITSLSGANGFQHTETASALTGSEGIVIDPSGNVWVANETGSSTITYLTVLVGAATPVGQPIPGKYGVEP